MRFLDIALFEMNVSNLDTIKNDFSGMLMNIANEKHYEIPKALFDLMVKRAVKAMQNDDAGNMVNKTPVTTVSDDTPPWLKSAIERGDEVYEIHFKETFQTSLAHVVDWMRADPDAGKVIKATPEPDFLGLLHKAADTFFANKNKEAEKKEAQSLSEPGTEIVATFRKTPSEQIVMFQEHTLDDNENGKVISFWIKLISAAALDREGKLMKHCVGSYADLVKSEAVVIYSLRDMKNEPHTTIELKINGNRPPVINQVKGGGNKPPLGKYTPYIKDFLNALGVSATHGGAEDVKGMGLFTHEGKFGTIIDVGGIIIEAFSNGDTIRTLKADEVPGWQRDDVSHDYMYVEKDGSVPFEFDINLELEKAARTVDPHAIMNRRVSGFKMLRKEVSRFPVYSKHMIEFLKKHELKGVTKTFEQIGVFYDARKKQWGTKSELTEHLFDFKGVSVSRIVEDVFFTDSKGTTFATAQLVRNILSNIKVINECESTKLLPELIKEFGNRVIKDQMSSKDARDYFAARGVFWNPAKNVYTGVPDNRSIIFKSKEGYVNHYMNRLFFFAPDGVLIASYYTGKEQQPYKLNERDFITFGTEGKSQLFKIFADISREQKPFLYFEYFQGRELREMGYFIENNRFVVASEVETDVKLGNGYIAATRVSDSGSRVLMLQKGEHQLATVYLDDDGATRKIEYSDGLFGQEYDDDGNKIAMTFDPKIIQYVAALLTVSKVSMKKCDILTNYLKIKGNKYVALDPIKDKGVLDFIKGRVDLGGDYVFISDIYLDRLGQKRRSGYESNDDYYAKRFGRVDYMGDDSKYGDRVCVIEMTPNDPGELSYKMTKNLPKGATRQNVIKAVAKFMHYYHEHIEEYISGDVWAPSEYHKEFEALKKNED